MDDKDRSMIQKERPRLKDNTKRSITMYARKLWIARVIPYQIFHDGTQRLNSGIIVKEGYYINQSAIDWFLRAKKSIKCKMIDSQ